MSLDIGFMLYEKKPFDNEGKFVDAAIDDSNTGRSGWGTPNESWGALFRFGNPFIVPVFQKELAEIKRNDDNNTFYEQYKLVAFDEFAEHVHDACADVYREAEEHKKYLYNQKVECQQVIKELRALQKDCTRDNAYAFDRWGEEIAANKERIREIEAEFCDDDFDEEQQAKSVSALLDLMEKYLKEDKYYIVPYYSC